MPLQRPFVNSPNGADSLGYLSLDGMLAAIGLPMNEFCAACYTGHYPSPIDAEHEKLSMEQRRARPGCGGAARTGGCG